MGDIGWENIRFDLLPTDLCADIRDAIKQDGYDWNIKALRLVLSEGDFLPHISFGIGFVSLGYLKQLKDKSCYASACATILTAAVTPALLAHVHFWSTP